VSYLIQERHKSSRWPVLVCNVSNKINRNMYTELHQHYSYITLIAGSCKDWVQYTFGFRKQLSTLSEGKLSESWKKNARFVTRLWKIAHILTVKIFHDPFLVIFGLNKLLPTPLTLPFSKTRYVALIMIPVSNGLLTTTTFQQFSTISLQYLACCRNLD